VRRLLWVLLTGAVLVAGCATDDGTAAPAEATGVQLPPRPRDVRIDGVDPCSLLTDEQKSALGFETLTFVDSSPSALYPGGDIPLCAIRGYEPRAISLGLSMVTTAGIELFTSGQLAAEVRPVTVGGFPAVVAVPTGFTKYCSVIVDVAPGQLLDVQFSDGGRVPPIPQDRLCSDAEQVADAAMATLLAGR
jgi:hypothetical protein